LRNRNLGHYGQSKGPIGTKVYFDGVTKEEQAKIEYNDMVEKIAYNFIKDNCERMYQDVGDTRGSLF